MDSFFRKTRVDEWRVDDDEMKWPLIEGKPGLAERLPVDVDELTRDAGHGRRFGCLVADVVVSWRQINGHGHRRVELAKALRCGSVPSLAWHRMHDVAKMEHELSSHLLEH